MAVNSFEFLGFNASASGLVGRKAKVLILDSSRVARTLLEDIFRDAEFLTHSVLSGSELWKALEEYGPDLVLLGSWIVDEDAMELLRELRQCPAFNELPIIVLVSGNSVKENMTAIDAGATDFICPPLEKVEVLTRAIKALQGVKNPLENAPEQSLSGGEIAISQPFHDVPTGCEQDVDCIDVDCGDVDCGDESRMAMQQAIVDAAHTLMQSHLVDELSPVVERIIDFARELRGFQRSNELSKTVQLCRYFLAVTNRLMTFEPVFERLLEVAVEDKLVDGLRNWPDDLIKMRHKSVEIIAGQEVKHALVTSKRVDSAAA